MAAVPAAVCCYGPADRRGVVPGGVSRKGLSCDSAAPQGKDERRSRPTEAAWRQHRKTNSPKQAAREAAKWPQRGRGPKQAPKRLQRGRVKAALRRVNRSDDHHGRRPNRCFVHVGIIVVARATWKADWRGTASSPPDRGSLRDEDPAVAAALSAEAQSSAVRNCANARLFRASGCACMKWRWVTTKRRGTHALLVVTAAGLVTCVLACLTGHKRSRNRPEQIALSGLNGWRRLYFTKRGTSRPLRASSHVHSRQ